jgi:serine/threonine protein phosphatase PrpC
MKVFKYSNIGNRETNEDYIVAKDFGNDLSLYLVADGMGGYSSGDIASKVVGDSYVYCVSRNIDIEKSTSVVSDNLKIEKKNLGVRKMGSTVAGILMNGMNATVFWAGDSRLYVFRNGDVIYQTEDHSIVNELEKKRKLTFEERERYGHILTRSLMGNKDDKVEIHPLELQKGDEVFICSDGIYNDCPVEYIMETIRSNSFDIDKHNWDFADNHSLIYLQV